MREFREYDDSDDTPEQTARRMTYKEREEILKALKIPTAEEVDEIIRTAAEECEYPRSEKIESYKGLISNRGKRMEYEFTKNFPSIDDEEITDVEELLEFIKQYRPSLMQRDDFQGLFHNAEIYLGLIADFHEHILLVQVIFLECQKKPVCQKQQLENG
jgi:hypothetical protein